MVHSVVETNGMEFYFPKSSMVQYVMLCSTVCYVVVCYVVQYDGIEKTEFLCRLCGM